MMSRDPLGYPPTTLSFITAVMVVLGDTWLHGSEAFADETVENDLPITCVVHDFAGQVVSKASFAVTSTSGAHLPDQV